MFPVSQETRPLLKASFDHFNKVPNRQFCIYISYQQIEDYFCRIADVINRSLLIITHSRLIQQYFRWKNSNLSNRFEVRLTFNSLRLVVLGFSTHSLNDLDNHTLMRNFTLNNHFCRVWKYLFQNMFFLLALKSHHTVCTSDKSYARIYRPLRGDIFL